MPLSSFWMFVIVISAAALAIANLQYSKALEAENNADKATQVRQLLAPEIDRNRKLVAEFAEATKAGKISLDEFETTAWQTVSGSDPLFGVKKDGLADLLHAYQLVNRANELHADILELRIGMASALGSSKETRELLMKEYGSILQHVESALDSVAQPSE